jgi:hypothetical protein
MATLQEVEAAFLRADQAGDIEAATVLAKEVSRLRSVKPDAAPVSRMDKIGMGLADPIQGGAQLLTKMLPDGVVKAGNTANNWLADKTGLVARLPEGGIDQQTQEREQAYQAQRSAAGESGFDGMRMLGNVASPVNLAIGGGLPAAASLAGRMGLGAVGGAASSALSPVTDGDFASEKLKQIGVGGLAGGVTPALAAGVGRVISPKASLNPDVQLLKAAGVNPTVGQTLGGRANALEEKLQSLPIMGDAIASARGKALQQFNNAAINRAVDPVGGTVEGVGQRAVAEAGDVLGRAYDDAIGTLKFVKFDDTFNADLKELKGMAKALTPPMRDKFNSTVRNIVGGRTTSGGTMLAETVKKADSELGQAASKFGRSSVASEQEYADAVRQLQALLRAQVARSSPEASKALKSADKGYANLVRVEGAAKAAKNAEGVFTPAQLNTAIQTADSSVRKRAVARGQALMQDLGTAGQNVLGNKVPNSGTADRMWLGAGAVGAGAINPLIPGGLLAGAAAYTPWGQALLRGAVSSRPSSAKSIADLLEKSSPMLGPAGGLLGLQMLE